MQDKLNRLEARAVQVMQRFDAAASFHDYLNIVRRVERAYRAVNSAYRAMSRAEEEVDEYEKRRNEGR